MGIKKEKAYDCIRNANMMKQNHYIIYMYVYNYTRGIPKLMGMIDYV